MDFPEANQKLHPIRDQFLVRFYNWSTEFSRREFGRNFPIVGRIKSPSIQGLVSFARSLNAEEKSLLCSALLKKFHPRAVEVLEDFPSVEETALLEQFLEARRAFASQGDTARLVAIVRRPSRARLRRILVRRLGATLGERQETVSSDEECTYCSRIRCWTVRTRIDTGGQRAFGYSHSIDAQYTVDLHSHISILSWMGISSQTDWFDLSEDDYSEAADSLMQVCTCFLDAAPGLLDGLSHNLPEPEVCAWREAVTVKGHRQNGMTIVTLDTPELRKAFRGKATWDIPTSIIPERLRAVGSHFAIVQDPAFSRESPDPLAVSPAYRHVRVELLDKGSRA